MSSDQKPPSSQTPSPRRNRRRRRDQGFLYLILLLTNVVVMLVWPIFVPIFGTLDYIVGYFVGLAFLTLVQPNYSRQTLKVLAFVGYALWEIVASSLQVARIVLQPSARLNESIKSAIVGVPLTVSSDVEIAILASLISLTPGTLSVDLGPNHKVLYVHTLSYTNSEEFRRQIKDGFERRLLEITRGSD